MRDYKHFVYMVCSNSGTLYIGMTDSGHRLTAEVRIADPKLARRRKPRRSCDYR